MKRNEAKRSEAKRSEAVKYDGMGWDGEVLHLFIYPPLRDLEIFCDWIVFSSIYLSIYLDEWID